ncbi:MAG: hypothetical protein VX642_03935 [Bdellovibrionota bacterium]|nr:hypothetical protein [Bdellovibrionota bacterium]
MKIPKLLFIGLFALINFACSSKMSLDNGNHTSSSTPGDKFVPLEAPESEQPQMEKAFRNVLAEIQDDSIFNEESCSSYLQGELSRLEQDSYSKFIEVSEISYSNFEKPAPRIIDTLFKIRLAAKQELDSFKDPSKACVSEIRRLIRSARYAEETLSEWLVTRVPQLDLEAQDFKSNNSLQKLVNPNYYESPEDFRFKSGDILLVRGETFVSATIARIGDDDGQFSHLALVYKPEPGTPYYGRTYVIEALIETGAIVKPIQMFLEHNHTRHVVYRPKGKAAEYAHKAGEQMLDRLKHQLDQWGNPLISHDWWNNLDFLDTLVDEKAIQYNFAMDLSLEDKMFCSQLVAIAYRDTSAGEIQIPRFKTTFDELSGFPLLTSLTVTTNETFAPSDIEFDDNVELVAEFRNLTKSDTGMYKTQKVKTQDAFFTVFLEKMHTHNYVVNPLFMNVDNLVTWVGIGWGKIQSFFGYGSEIVPSTAPASFMRKAVAMEFMQKEMMEDLFNYEMNHFNRYGYSIPYGKLMEQIELARVIDCIDYMAEENGYRKTQLEVGYEPKEKMFASYYKPVKKIFEDSKYHGIFRPADDMSCLDPNREIATYSRDELVELRTSLSQ